jgi:Arc/MetJ-type ribon-helix-helix transcriptional regulator
MIASPLHVPSTWMVLDMTMMGSNVQELRPRAADSEKITINLGYVDLGHIDLLVKDRFYSNRTDFIRTAIRNQLDRYDNVTKQSITRNQLDLGLRHYTRQDLEAARRAGNTLHIQVLGLVVIAPDVSPELACATIASIHVLGALQASPAVKAALSDRMRSVPISLISTCHSLHVFIRDGRRSHSV